MRPAPAVVHISAPSIPAADAGQADALTGRGVLDTLRGSRHHIRRPAATGDIYEPTVQPGPRSCGPAHADGDRSHAPREAGPGAHRPEAHGTGRCLLCLLGPPLSGRSTNPRSPSKRAPVFLLECAPSDDITPPAAGPVRRRRGNSKEHKAATSRFTFYSTSRLIEMQKHLNAL